MAILAMDSSTNTASVALVDNGKLLCENFLNAGLTHSQTLLPMVENILKSVKNIEIDKIAVTVGPGSFTGIRIAVSAAKGLSFIKNIDCVEVSSLEALAYNCKNIREKYIICSMLDARLKRVYSSVFTLENGEITRNTNDDCLSFEDLEKQLLKFKEKLIIIGDGVNLFIKEYPEYAEFARDGDINYIKASSVALASANKNIISGAKLNPLYLQQPQAVRERLAKLKNSEK